MWNTPKIFLPFLWHKTFELNCAWWLSNNIFTAANIAKVFKK